MNVLAEIRLTPPRRARRRMAGLVMPWMLSRRIFRWRLAPPFPRPFPPLPPVEDASVGYQQAGTVTHAEAEASVGVQMVYLRPVILIEVK